MKRKKLLLIIISCIAFIVLTLSAILLITNKIKNGNNADGAPTWGEWTIVTNPTCEVTGLKQRSNSNGEKETQEIPALGHDYNITPKEVSCTKDGFNIYICNRCEHTFVSDFQNAYGHLYGEWLSTKSVTCTSNGTEEQICIHCNHAQKHSIPATGHKYTPISSETIDSVLYITYKCEFCDSQEVVKDGEEIESFIGNVELFDVSPKFSFIIKTANDENYILNNLKIIDAYFNETEYESQDAVNVKYKLRKLDSSDKWEVTPEEDYEFNLTYLAKLSGNIEFEEYTGNSITFTIVEDDNHINNVEYKSNIIFLQALENESPGYYPYLITAPENSEYIYLTLGKADNLEIGQIICIGNITDISQLSADTQCDFGKIFDIYPLQTGEKVLVLEEPPIEEIFSNLDISYNELVDLESANIDTEELEKDLINALYANKDFIKFLSAVNVTTTEYLSYRNLSSTDMLSVKSFMDRVNIDTDISFNGSLLSALIYGSIDIPIEDGNSQNIGSITVKFNMNVESAFSIDVGYQLKKLWGIPYKIQYFDMGLNQNNKISFDFSVDITMDYTLDVEEGKYLQNTDSGKIHRKGCIHLNTIKDPSKIKPISVFDANTLININPDNECKTCHPTTEFYYEILLLNNNKGIIHALNCSEALKMDPSNMSFSKEPHTFWLAEGYSCCDICHPQNREERGYQIILFESLQYSDWQNVATDISQWAKDAGIEAHEDAKGLTLLNFNFVIYGPISAGIRIDFVFSFKLDASLSYEYEYVQQTKYGMRLSNGGVTKYNSQTSEVVKNDLTLMGQAKMKMGLLVDANIHITGLSRWIRAGVTGEIGLYAEISGILHLSGVTHENYAAAYLEAGIYLDIDAYFKLLAWSGNITIYSNEWPIVQYGYEKAYFGYLNPVEALEVNGKYDISALLKVKYFDLKKMISNNTTLNVNGVPNLYEVVISLENGQYFEIENGQIIVKPNAPCEFTDTLTISVKGTASWKKYVKDSSVFYLKDYIIELSGIGTTHHEVNHICQICNKQISECLDNNNDHECDICSQSISECSSANSGHTCDTCGKALTDCIDTDLNHKCDICQANVGIHEDTANDGDHACDYCHVVINACIDKDYNHICDECGSISAHTGGYATCTTKAICSICNEPYGDLNYNNHSGIEKWINTESTHKKIYDCCSVEITTSEPHNWSDTYCDTYITCSVCNATGKLGSKHYEINHDAKDPTCTNTGWNAYITCSRCDFSTYQEIPATGHYPSNWIIDIEATYETDGSKHKICTVCSEIVEISIIPMLKHSYTSVKTEPTCTEQGYTTHTCSDCGNSYIDDYIPATGHSFGAWSQFKAPNCTESGAEGRTCAYCMHIDTRDIPPIGHNEINHPSKDPDCFNVGWNAYVTCSRCDYSTYKEIAMTPHEWQEATCVMPKTCVNCGATEGEALGHAEYIHHPGTTPTCTEVGYSEEVRCANCELVLVPSKEIAATGHIGGTSTCTAKATCSKCGEAYGELIDHNYINGTCSHCGKTEVEFEILARALSFDTSTIIISTYSEFQDFLNEYGDYYNITINEEYFNDNVLIVFPVFYSYGVINITGYNIQNDELTISVENQYSSCCGCVTIMPIYYDVFCMKANKNLTQSINNINIVRTENITYIHEYIQKNDENSHWNECICMEIEPGSVENHKLVNNKCTECKYEHVIEDVIGTNGITYKLSADGTYAIVTGYTGTDTEIIIADKYLGVPVKVIGELAFYGRLNITSVTIGSNIISIERAAFWQCQNLKNVTFNSSIECIGDAAFSHCYSIINISIPSSVIEIKDSAFVGCSHLENVVLSDGVKHIGGLAFQDCVLLERIIIPNSVNYIGYDIFKNCTKLTTINFTGTEEDWSTISIENGNNTLNSASIIYNYKPE